MSIGKHVADLLDAQGIARQELADKMHISPAAVTGMLNRSTHRESSAYRMAEAINSILADRGDPRRVSAESLRRGPDLVQNSYAIQEVTGVSTEWVTLRDYGGVPCGGPLELGDVGVGDMAVPAELLRRGETPENCFVVHAEGPSMEGEGIADGDVMLVRTDLEPASGQVVLVTVNRATTCRRLVRDGAVSWLESVGGPGYRAAPIRLGDGDEVAVHGRVVRSWAVREH